jgi:transposase InsO family protein
MIEASIIRTTKFFSLATLLGCSMAMLPYTAHAAGMTIGAGNTVNLADGTIDLGCGALIHHSDRGSQYVSIRYSERLAEAGIEPSVGSRGDSYDNALAETINGLYKTELIHRRGPWKTRESVEMATLKWVHWFNHHRLLEPIGYIPPAEAGANYWWQLAENEKRAA